MTAMFDEIFDRQYQSGRNDLHDGIDRLVKRVGAAIGNTFATIHRVQFDAPWAKKDGHCM
jgi:16S rRNA U516 pseudouridylate synthase RsuA-like enzyme